MALNQTAANSLLKQFIAQETSGCPDWFCKNLCTLGLLKPGATGGSDTGPIIKSSATDPITYWTYELDTGSAPGYEREVLGKISGSSIVEELRKMSTPANSSTYNDQIIVLGENSNPPTGNAWPGVKYFGIWNALYSADASEGGERYSQHLVLWGQLTMPQGSTVITVDPETVPLFRKNNFTLTFTST